MATAKEQLLANMNPQMARLLDNQMRDQQVAQRSQGAGMLAGLTQAYTGMGDIASRALGAAPMGANEMQAVQAQQQQTQGLNQAKEFALLSVQSNPTLGEEQQAKATQLIQNSNSVSQLDAIAKRFGKSSSGSPAVEKLSDGSVIKIDNNGVTQVSPPDLSGFMGMSATGLQDSHSGDSVLAAQQLYRQGLKEKVPEDELRRKVSKALQPNLNEFTQDYYVETSQMAKGYGLFDQGLPRTIEALDNANVGSLGGIKQFFSKAAESVGIDLNGVEDTELINRILTKEVLNNAQFMKGTLSDKDIEFLKQTVGTQGTSLEGLKEAFVELAVRKEVAYKTNQEFGKLNNREKNKFDFEAAKGKYYKDSRNKYSEMFGLEKRQSDKANVPAMLDRNSAVSTPSEQDIVDFFSLPKN